MAMECSLCAVIAGVKDPGAIAVTEAYWVLMPALHQVPGHHGHMILAPRQHRVRLADLDSAEANDLVGVLLKATAAVRDACGAGGTTIRQNDGPPAQDTQHVHFHIVPRFEGDRFWDGEPEIIDAEVLIDQARRFAEAYRAVS